MGDAVARSPGRSGRVSAAVVIITYERPEVLRDTLDFWRRVQPGPDQFLVVDASAKAAEHRASVLRDYAELFESATSGYVVVDRPSITRQRNVGLSLVQTDVVLFTDDESKPEADYVAKIVEVFECDEGGVVGGVGGSERDEETPVARARRAGQNAGRLVARRFTGPPGQRWMDRRHLPPGVTGLPIVRVRHLHGAKMSFRTAVAKSLGFDPHMLRYAYCEDLDLSIRVGATHVLLQRMDAFVAHEESQRARVPSEATFLVSWVNPAYLTEKLCAGAPRRRPLQRLLLAKEAAELLRPATLVRSDRRADVYARYGLARHMIAYLQGSPPGELTGRFDLVQRYIFEVRRSPGEPRLDHFRRWLVTNESESPRLVSN
jgi:hypothetical protein